ncbi:uncharacterized protein LOC144602894 [Rhinoraja longicauda]
MWSNGSSPGATIQLECTVVGDARRYWWQKDGVDIPHHHLVEGNRSLVLLDVTRKNCGIYTCTVSNPVSYVQEDYTLTIYGLQQMDIVVIVASIVGIIFPTTSFIGLLVLCISRKKLVQAPLRQHKRWVLLLVASNTISLVAIFIALIFWMVIRGMSPHYILSDRTCLSHCGCFLHCVCPPAVQPVVDHHCLEIGLPLHRASLGLHRCTGLDGRLLYRQLLHRSRQLHRHSPRRDSAKKSRLLRNYSNLEHTGPNYHQCCSDLPCFFRIGNKDTTNNVNNEEEQPEEIQLNNINTEHAASEDEGGKLKSSSLRDAENGSADRSLSTEKHRAIATTAGASNGSLMASRCY